jgi:ferritin-like metal-binding protein YciE
VDKAEKAEQKAEQKVVQYLNEAHATEMGLVRVLQSQIAMTPRGSYRSALEKHLGETRSHAERLEKRIGEVQESGNPVQAGIGLMETVLSQAFALSKTPLDLLRGSGGEEKVLKNAKDAAATEALEIATYTALERLASDLDDETTAKLAASIRADEEKMLDRIMQEIPKLTDAVVRAEIKGEDVYDLSETGAADAVREVAEDAKETAQKTATRAKRATTRQARKVPGMTEAEGAVKGAFASEEDLAIPDYDSLTADEIVEKLPQLSQIDLAKIEAYERKHGSRTTILNRISALRGDEPWSGYDDMTAEEIVKRLRDADEETAKRVRAYERSHKSRTSVLGAAERELTHA